MTEAARPPQGREQHVVVGHLGVVTMTARGTGIAEIARPSMVLARGGRGSMCSINLRQAQPPS